jgi:hypothetical protein
LADGTIWLAQSERGKAIIMRMVNFTPQRASEFAQEYIWQTYSTVSDATAFTYQQNGHEFYVLNFPTADATWVYDVSENQWHQRGWWDTSLGVYHRARANCACEFQGVVLVGDYRNGGVYQFSPNVYTEAGGTPLRRLRRAPHIQTDHHQQFFEMLQIEFQPGVGLLSGQGSNPQAMLRWSDDGGSTWSNEHWRTIGSEGAYKNRAIWFGLGQSRDRIFEVSISDPVNTVIINATLEMSAGAH